MYLLILSNNMCVNDHEDQDFKLACVQHCLDICLSNCVGFGGWIDFSGKDEGFGSKGPGGAIEGVGGKGVESKFQDGGMGRSIEEEGDRNGGFGPDSSVERLGSEGIDRTRRGCVEGCIDGGDCVEGGIYGGESRVDLAEENCVGFGGFGSRRSHMNIFLKVFETSVAC